MRKWLSFLAILSLIFIFVACSGTENSGDGSNKNVNNNGNNGENPDEVTITYAHWNLGTEEDEEKNLQRLMVEQFQEDYPHVTIELHEVSGDWNEELAAAASAGNMPDVFALSNLPIALANDWLLDLTDLVEDDEDYANVPEIVRQSIVYDDKVVAIPYNQNFLGYFVNKDLFNAANLDYPTMDSSVEEFEEAIKDVTNVGDGIIGVTNTASIPDWYPASVSDMGWYTYDYNDGTYSLDSSEFMAGVNLALDLNTNGYAFAPLSDDQKANFASENGGDVWVGGDIGVHWDGTWAIQHLSDNANFEFDFIGIPGGKTVITNDILGISKTTDVPEEAYFFAKYLSFGKEGYMRTIEVAEETGKQMNGLPVNADQEILDEFFALLDVPGVRKAYDKLDESILEPVKTVPGFNDARWNAPTGVKTEEEENANIAELLNSFTSGELKAEDYVSELNKLANEAYEEAVSNIE